MVVHLILTEKMIKHFLDCTKTGNYKTYLNENQKFIRTLSDSLKKVNFEVGNTIPNMISRNLQFYINYLTEYDPKNPNGIVRGVKLLERFTPTLTDSLKTAIATKSWSSFYSEYSSIADFMINEARKQKILEFQIECSAAIFDTFEDRDMMAQINIRDQSQEPLDIEVRTECESPLFLPRDFLFGSEMVLDSSSPKTDTSLLKPSKNEQTEDSESTCSESSITSYVVNDDHAENINILKAELSNQHKLVELKFTKLQENMKKEFDERLELANWENRKLRSEFNNRMMAFYTMHDKMKEQFEKKMELFEAEIVDLKNSRLERKIESVNSIKAEVPDFHQVADQGTEENVNISSIECVILTEKQKFSSESEQGDFIFLATSESNLPVIDEEEEMRIQQEAFQRRLAEQNRMNEERFRAVRERRLQMNRAAEEERRAMNNGITRAAATRMSFH